MWAGVWFGAEGRDPVMVGSGLTVEFRDGYLSYRCLAELLHHRRRVWQMTVMVDPETVDGVRWRVAGVGVGPGLPWNLRGVMKWWRQRIANTPEAFNME